MLTRNFDFANRRSVDPTFVPIIAVSLVSKSDGFNLGEEISLRDGNCRIFFLFSDKKN